MEKTIALSKVRRGEVFTLDGVRFVMLRDCGTAAFVVTEDVALRGVPFESDDAEREDHNNYSGSSLEKQAERWLREEHPEIFRATEERPIDLTTMDGMTDYGTPLAVVRALTIDEYRRERAVLPLTSEPYWLATGWTTLRSPSSDASSAYYILTDGSVYRSYVSYPIFAARPALYLKSSILVSIEDGEKQGLEGYTELDLLAELQRRVQK